MNIKQLRYVTAIIAAGSFSAAAVVERVSVQAVSKAIGELEIEVGEPLFIRENSGVRPTRLGRAFGSRAGRVLSEYDSLQEFVSRRDIAGAEDLLRIGFCCPQFPGSEGLYGLIATVASRTLHRKVEVLCADLNHHMEELRDGCFDALITIGMIGGDGIVCGSLGTMSPYVLMAETNPLAKKDELTIADINTCPVAYSSVFDQYNSSVCNTYVSRGVTSELVKVLTNEEFTDLILRKNGLTFIVGGDFIGPMPGRAIRPIAAADRVPVPICLSTLEGSDISYVEWRHALAKMKLLG